MEVALMPNKPTTKPASAAPPAADAKNGAAAPQATVQTTFQAAQAPGQAQRPTAPALTGGAALGHAVWLMMNMPMYRHVFLSDLEWMVLPPILLNQFRLFNADNKVVAFAAWAYLSGEVEKRLQEPNPRLAPAEWKSGDRLWLIDVFAPFGHTEAALQELRDTAFAGKSFKMHRMQPDGKRVVIEISSPDDVHGRVG
jgi:cytolysin-activating lysine-acyltransferase